MKISTAKFRLYNKSPFFGTLIFNLPIEETTEIPTLGVDGEVLYINNKFWDSLNDKEQLGTLCHEVGHLFLGHIWRQKHRNEIAIDPTSGQSIFVFNLAGDYVINAMIRKDPNFSLPSKHLYDKKYEGWSTEEVYADLLKRIPKMSKQDLHILLHSAICDKSKWGKGQKNKKEAKTNEAKWKQIGKQAMEVAKQRGNLPEFLKRLYDKLEPKEDWRKILMEYAQRFSNDYSFNPVDRRFLDEDFLLPDIQEGHKLDWLAIAVDTSGSISSRELNAFVAELKGIMQSFDRVKIRLTFCDTVATPFIELEEFDTKQIKPSGGGGTSFKEPFKLVEKLKDNPLALLYFTDLYGDFPSKKPNYNTIWVYSAEEIKVPFGKVLPYKV